MPLEENQSAGAGAGMLLTIAASAAAAAVLAVLLVTRHNTHRVVTAPRTVVGAGLDLVLQRRTISDETQAGKG